MYSASFLNSLKILVALLQRDIKVMFYRFSDNIIDSLIIVGFWYLTYGHLLPLMGMDISLITPIFFGIIMTVLLNVTWDRAILDALDLDFTRFIDYQLALPLSLNWLLAKYVLSYVIDLIVATFPVILLGRLAFGSLLDVQQGSLFFFIITYLLCILLTSVMLLVLVIAKPFWWVRDNAWPRILLPLSLFGAYYYPWRAVAYTLPWVAHAYLLNPFIYMIEGMRSAATGSPVYLSLSLCIGMQLALIVVFIALLLFAVRKRIDPLV